MNSATQPRPDWQFWAVAVAAVLLQLGWSRLLGVEMASWLASPLLPLAVCLGALRADRWFLLPLALAVVVMQPLVNWLAYDMAPSLGWMAVALPGYALFWLAGRLLRPTLDSSAPRSVRLAKMVGSGLAASLLFYLLANTAAWLGSAGYAPTLEGWIQAQTVGLPGFAPSWTFLRALVAAQLIFVPAWTLVLARLELSEPLRNPFQTPKLGVAQPQGRL